MNVVRGVTDLCESIFTESKVKLFDLYLNSDSLQSFLNHASTIFHNPIIMCDEAFRIISASNIFPVKDKYWRKHLIEGACSYEFVSRVNQLEAIKAGKQKNEAYRVFCPESEDEKFVCRVKLKDKELGNVILLEEQSTFTEETGMLMEIMSILVGKLMMEYQKETVEYAVLSENFLLKLVQNTVTTKELDRIEQLVDYKLPKELTLVIFNMANYKVNVTKRSRDLKELIHSKWKAVLSIVHEDTIIMLFETALLKNRIAEIEEFVTFHQIIAGMSRNYHSILETYKYYEQAKKAIEIGPILTKGKHVFVYDDVFPFVFLPKLPIDEAISEFAHASIKLLKTYDDENGTQLNDVLYQYLLHKEKINETANHLFVHRNTLRYQLNKAYEIGKIQSEDSLFMANLFLSYRILHYYRKRSLIELSN